MWLKRKGNRGEADPRGIEVERKYWPAKILDAPLETFMTPIKSWYAEALFDVELAKQTLFPRSRRLGLSREHVYYRSPRGNAGMASPARILWYVTARANALGTGEVVACSRLDEVVSGPPRLLFQRFRHLGVYQLRDVMEASTEGSVMALRFVDTEMFSNRVPLKALRSLASSQGHGLFLQGPWRISSSFFESVYRSGVRQ
jgi:hypothetical protein